MATKKSPQAKRSTQEVRKEITQRFIDELLIDLARTKARCKMLRKLRDVRIIRVMEPNGNTVGLYSIPTFAMEKNHMLKMDELIGRFRREFDQEVVIGVPIVCDTMLDLESEMMSLNQIDDQKEDDGIEDAKE
jgi:hypothetical protein